MQTNEKVTKRPNMGGYPYSTRKGKHNRWITNHIFPQWHYSLIGWMMLILMMVLVACTPGNSPEPVAETETNQVVVDPTQAPEIAESEPTKAPAAPAEPAAAPTDKPEATLEPTAEPTAETEVGADLLRPRTVTDVNGLKAVITDDNQIITLGGSVTEIVYALGAGDRVIATDVSSTHPEAATQLPQVGYVRTLSAEPVLAMAPTLILTTNEAGPPEALAQLQESGVTIVMFAAATSPEEAYQLMRNLGLALGKETEAEELIAQVESDLAEAAMLLEQAESKPSVLFIYARGVDTVMAGGLDTGVDTMLALAGAENAFTEFEGYQPLTAEAAVAAAPDAYLLFTSGLASVGGVEGLLAVPGLGATPAGENQRVYEMDGLLLTSFGPRFGQAVIDLIHLLHPELAS